MEFYDVSFIFDHLYKIRIIPASYGETLGQDLADKTMTHLSEKFGAKPLPLAPTRLGGQLSGVTLAEARSPARVILVNHRGVVTAYYAGAVDLLAPTINSQQQRAAEKQRETNQRGIEGL